jgi:hypothetical protein
VRGDDWKGEPIQPLLDVIRGARAAMPLPVVPARSGAPRALVASVHPAIAHWIATQDCITSALVGFDNPAEILRFREALYSRRINYAAVGSAR